ncbi:hypothetical protein KKD62_02965 [Patescibacteria group bacterium]|nr:hypothetical protein [Patescibacteria group bacterium]MBU1931493.1 hypothetical protein [Patescibacteria group bacterium]
MKLAVNIGDAFRLGNQGIEGKTGYDTIGSLVSIILKNVYIFSGIIILFLLIGGGFTMIANAGNPEKQQQGSKAVSSALIGFLIIFCSYWIIQIIEVITGVKIFNPPGL